MSTDLFTFEQKKEGNFKFIIYMSKVFEGRTRWKIAQAAEIRWWQNYLKKKPVGDYLTWKKAYWEKLLDEIEVHTKPNSQVLDAGCGPAGIFMVTNACKTDAVDPLLNDYAEKIDHFKKENYPSVRFYSQALEAYTPDVAYDTIFCMNAINHVSDLDQCFDKLVEMTKPGGELVVSIDAHNYGFFKHLFRLLPGDILHPHQFDLEEYQEMLTKRNCTITRTVLYNKEFFFNYFILVVKKAD